MNHHNHVETCPTCLIEMHLEHLLEGKLCSQCSNTITLDKLEDASFWATLANEYAMDLKFSEAIKCIMKSIEINPNNSENWFEGYRIFLSAEKYEKALPFIEKALDLDSSNDVMWVNKANLLYIYLKRYEDALNAVNEALKLKPDDEGIFILKADILRLASHFHDAIELYDKILQLRKDIPDESHNAFLWHKKAQAYYQSDIQNKLEMALDFVDKAISLQKKKDTHYLTWDLALKANVLTEMGRNDDALEIVSEILGLYPDYPDAIYIRARVNAKLGAIEQAKKDLALANKISNEKNLDVHNNILKKAEADCFLKLLLPL